MFKIVGQGIQFSCYFVCVLFVKQADVSFGLGLSFGAKMQLYCYIVVVC